MIWRTTIVSLILLGCGPGHDHGHGANVHVHEDERPELSFTDWSEHTELFIELPALVRGLDSPCAAHVTKLDGFQRLAEGRVTVTLTGGESQERFVVERPTVPGIFRPVVRPSRAGKFSLDVEIELGEWKARHALGEVTVYANSASAKSSIPDEPEPTGRITFLKEQQWPISFGTATASEQELHPSIRVPGTLVTPIDADLTVRAPVAGRIMPGDGSFPEVGRAVKAGDTLLVLAPRLEAADIASLTLAIQKGELELRYTESERERLEGLRKEGAVPERRVIEAIHEQDSARAALATARRRLDQFRRMETSRGRGQGSIPLLAPFAGVVQGVYLGKSAFVEAGSPVMRLLDASQLRLEVQLAERDAHRAPDVRGAVFTTPSGTLVELGSQSLVARSPTVDPHKRTLSLWFAVPNNDRLLAAGMLVDAAVRLGNPSPHLAVLESALIDDGGTRVVFVQVEGESFERRVVRTGARDGGLIAIESGLAVGDRVVTIGAYAVKLAAASSAIPAHGHAH